MSKELDEKFWALRDELWAKTDGRCWYCGEETVGPSRTIDHVVPRSSGGGENIQNLVAACRKCNGAKGTLSVEEFRLRLARMKAGWPHFSKRQLLWLQEVGLFLSLPSVIFYGERGETRCASRASEDAEEQ